MGKRKHLTSDERELAFYERVDREAKGSVPAGGDPDEWNRAIGYYPRGVSVKEEQHTQA